MFDYEVLKVLWWVLIGVLLIGFALTDGFDMGAMILMPLIGRTDQERRVAINAIAPHWDGNQVWFITAGGALFAAWPMVYAVAFSGLYWALLLVLFALFLRPVGFDYRSKLDHQRWRKAWDWGLFAGSLVPALVFGVAFGNLFQGVPFRLDDTLRSTYDGSFFALLNPYALLAGLVSLSMLTAHGGAWLMLRTDGVLHERASKAVRVCACLFLACFVLAGVWLVTGQQGMTLAQIGDTGSALNVLQKTVTLDNPGWLANYIHHPAIAIAPVLALFGAAMAFGAAGARKDGLTFLGTSLAIVGTICTAGFALFPFVLPSSIDPASSLTMWDAVSSRKTMGIMAVAAGIFVPTILAYTLWSYYRMWARMTTAHIDANQHSLY